MRNQQQSKLPNRTHTQETNNVKKCAEWKKPRTTQVSITCRINNKNKCTFFMAFTLFDIAIRSSLQIIFTFLQRSAKSKIQSEQKKQQSKMKNLYPQQIFLHSIVSDARNAISSRKRISAASEIWPVDAIVWFIWSVAKLHKNSYRIRERWFLCPGFVFPSSLVRSLSVCFHLNIFVSLFHRVSS